MISLTPFYLMFMVLLIEFMILVYVSVKKYTLKAEKLLDQSDFVDLFKVLIYGYFAFLLYDNIVSTTSADIIDVIFEQVFYFCIVIIFMRLLTSKYFKDALKTKRKN